MINSGDSSIVFRSILLPYIEERGGREGIGEGYQRLTAMTITITATTTTTATTTNTNTTTTTTAAATTTNTDGGNPLDRLTTELGRSAIIIMDRRLGHMLVVIAVVVVVVLLLLLHPIAWKPIGNPLLRPCHHHNNISTL